MDDGKKCLGHKSFNSMEKFIGKNRVKNLNEYMKKHESKYLFYFAFGFFLICYKIKI